jgi:spoIIIJ-associated protein
VEAETMPVPAQAERATAFAQELVRTMGFEARVEADVDEDEVLVRIDGEGLGVLVGPKGATLRALEELVRAVVQHVAGGHSARVHVDVSGYRERRRAALTAFAEKIAIEVRDTGVERSLEPMPPPDRKVVHDAVSEIDGVATGSEGEEPRRRVVIRPA